ncbi:MAG: prepilin-type N-terminal cleavage/methylation domain-containing protein [Gemmatimonadaceae bacterium]|nr:prepilin-type N-terminal cleavage/methylation domain-containing protein [Gemmatimonadaceae bacterium]
MSRRGTSLVEMLIVLVLLGIMTTIAAPRLRPSPHGQVEQNTRLLAQDLDHARTRAYAARTLVRVVVSDTLWQSFLDQDRDTVINETATEQTAFGAMSSRILGDNIVFGRGAAPPLPTDTVGTPPPGVQRIQFGPRGTTEPFGSSITLYLTHDTDDTAVSAVEINPAANVRVWRWVDGIWQ